jgi:hypothetical protein
MTSKNLKIHGTLFLAIIAGFLFLLQPFFTWFVADDYCYMPQVQSEGVFARMWHDYMTWDGRCISLTYPFSRTGLFYGVYWLGPLMASVLLLSTIFLILKKINSVNFVNMMVMTGIFWLAAFNFLSQTLYWTTAIGYILDVSMLFWAYLLFSTWKHTVKYFVLAVPVYFYAGTASPNGVLALLLVLIITGIYESWKMKKWDVVKYAVPFLIILTGFLMVVLSPGNANRLVGMEKANLTHIWTIYFNTKLTFSKLWDFNTPVIWMLFTVGFIGAMQKTLLVKNVWGSIAQFLFSNKWALAALLSVVFYIPFPGLNSPRTNIHFVFFVFLYALESFEQLRTQSEWSNSFLSFTKKAVLLVFIVIAASQLFDANYSKKRIAERAEKLTSLKGQAVILTDDDRIKAPGTRRFEDVSTDSSYWLNQCVANYYGLKYIKFEEPKCSK